MIAKVLRRLISLVISASDTYDFLNYVHDRVHKMLGSLQGYGDHLPGAPIRTTFCRSRSDYTGRGAEIRPETLDRPILNPLPVPGCGAAYSTSASDLKMGHDLPDARSG
jgi:hypothetical protein